jgi:sugar/nucleoside kinase (ribokinase family)
LSLYSHLKAVIVTLGKHGCVVGKKRQIHDVKIFPARPTNAVDTIVSYSIYNILGNIFFEYILIKKGAGDAFIGAIAHYLSKSRENFFDEIVFDRSVELAVEYASLTVERKGAQTSYPYINELDSKFH